MAKKTKAEHWGESQVNYNRPLEDLRIELKQIRRATERRLEALARNRSFSYAKESLERQLKKVYLNGMKPDVNKLKFQQVEKELAMYHKFWSSSTSTVKGAKEEQIKQSARIFGKDTRGRPRRVLTLEEGRLFWAAYARFKESYKETTQYDSRRILRLLGEHMGTVLDPDTDWAEFLEKFYQEVEADYNHTQFNDAPIDWDEVYEEYL